MPAQPKILVCPLDWGIGHATRSVPVIRELLRQGATVHLGASGLSKAFLEEEFPELDMHEFPGFRVSYPSKGSGMVRKMMAQAPSLVRSVRNENTRLEAMVERFGLNGVISDNRYGLYHREVPCIFITHQVFIQTPPGLRFIRGMLDRTIRNYIDRYQECWIPDLEGASNLSGNLSHRDPLPGNFHFIGPLTRFTPRASYTEGTDGEGSSVEVLVVLSGPEPQRSILEDHLLKELYRIEANTVLVRGKPGADKIPEVPGHCIVHNHLGSAELESLIRRSRLIISRPGYSTLMDLAALGKKAVLIPTPGQTEQEYLAAHHRSLGHYLVIRQDSLRLNEALEQGPQFPGMTIRSNGKALEERVEHFLGRIK